MAGGLLGFAVHFKIYPFIYAAGIFCWADPAHVGSVMGVTKDRDRPIWLEKALAVFNPARRKLTAVSALTFIFFNAAMVKP